MENWLARTELLIGKDKIDILSDSTVMIAGLGGVGAYAAEMCVRAGIGNVIIIDSDVISFTNLNRQILALHSTIGKKKSELMESRLLDINPDLKIVKIDSFIDESNIDQILGNLQPDFIVDAIDTLSPKIALILFALKRKIPLVSSMGAGAKYDITGIKIKDISKSYNCPLAYVLRKRLRKCGVNKGFKVVFSEELPDNEAIMAVEERNKKSIVGTISYIPAVFGCACAQVAIEELLRDK